MLIKFLFTVILKVDNTGGNNFDRAWTTLKVITHFPNLSL